MKPPFVTASDQILIAVKATLDAFDWATAGIPGLTIRHARRKFATPDQYPCLTIRWEQDQVRQADQDQNWLTPDEMAVDMLLTLEVELQTSEVEDDEDQQDDPTGLGVASAIAALAQRALRDEDGILLRLWAGGVSDRGRGEDIESTGDDIRFEQAIGVLYRVSTRDPSQILAPGVNL